MYRLVYGAFYLLSLLPFRVLYFLGDIATFFIRDVFGYRKAVVMDNLQKAFPHKTPAERKKIAHSFYRNFTDNWMETIKLLTISQETLNKRMKADYSIFEQLHPNGKPVVIVGGHFYNWEFANLQLGYRQPYQMLSVYMPISNKVIDRLFIKLRSRWGNAMVRATNMRQDMIAWRNTRYAMGLIADQSPAGPGSAHWLYFLNQPSCVVRGPERTATMMDAPVIMLQYSRIKRGYYELKFECISSHPASEKPGSITRRFIKSLEKNIEQTPEIYLWSHNRWKLKWDPAYKNLWIDELPAPEKAPL